MGIVRRGFLTSPAMWVPTSQPANAHTNRLIASPTPAHPLGRNGVKFDASTAGNVTATTPTTTDSRRPVSTNCTQPATRTPNQLAMNGGTKTAKPMIGTAARSTPSTATTYSPPRIATTGAPTQTPK